MIINFLKDIKHRLSKIKNDFLKLLYFYLSIRRIDRRIRKKRKNKLCKINIGFVLQEYSLFDKLYNVFLEFKKHDNIYIKAIVLPSYDIKTNTINKNDHTNLDLFITKIGKDSIIEEDEFDKIEFDYIFINRPYDHYVKDKFKTINLYKKSKICYTPYGSIISKFFMDYNVNNEFNYYVNMFFADNEMIKTELVNKYRNQIIIGTKKVFYVGYPSLEKYVSYNYKNSLIDKKEINILYTPRWSTDKNIGGSTFFDIKDKIIELSKMNNIKLYFRPHPMMFDNFIKNNQMTEYEVSNYKKELMNNGAIIYDKGNVCDILDKMDIILTDYTSLIMEYYLTGKPILYIEKGMFELLDIYKHILDENYCIHSDDEVLEVVKEVIKNNDPKFAKRINNVMKESRNNLSASKSIYNEIFKDYYGKILM